MGSKEKVLELLELNKADYISGEAMALKLGLSRNAIWKAINELRKQGYTVEAVSKKGYRLSDNNDILSIAGILAHVNPEVAKIYANSDNLIHIYEETTSTNSIAMELAACECIHGTLVLADEQTAGRARLAGSFDSPKGGLYMSIVLTPEHLPSTKPEEITAFIGNAVCNAIANISSASPELRPVNDIYIDDKKICGILTEASSEFETGRLQWLIAGIGIRKDLKDYSTASRNQLVGEILNRMTSC